MRRAPAAAVAAAGVVLVLPASSALPQAAWGAPGPPSVAASGVTDARSVVVSGQGPRWWPQWRGPLGTGVMPGGRAPVAFDDRTEVVWKIEVPGRGLSTPIVWGDRIFLTTAVPAREPLPRRERLRQRWKQPVEHAFTVLCIDRGSGALLWRRVARRAVPHEGIHPSLSSYANASPVTDGEHVYAFFGSQGLYAYDFEGELVWSRDFGVRMQVYNSFGESSSPALHGDRIVLLFDHEGQSFIEAVDRRSGDTLWRRERDSDTSWSSPHVAVHEGRAQVVVTGGGRVTSYDLETGEPIWYVDGMSPHPVPTPVSGLGMVFAASGTSERRIRAIHLGYGGDLTDHPAVAWGLDRAAPYNPTPLLWGDELYVVRDGGLSRGTSRLSAFDARTGEPHYWQERLPGGFTVKASPVGAGDSIYLPTEEGDVLVIRRGKRFELLASRPLGEMFLASPAIVDGQLILRGLGHLFLIAD